MYIYDEDTAVLATGASEYAATISDRWNTGGGHANGGYALGVMLSALAAELPYPDPLVVSASYLRRVPPGPVSIHVEAVRTGRRLAVGEARMMQYGKELVRAVATFTDLTKASGRTHLDNSAPDLPAPDDCADPTGGWTLPGLSIGERIEYRMPSPPGWAVGVPTGHAMAEFWMRYADGRPADTVTLPMLVDAAFPAVLELGEFGSTTIELTAHVRGRPAPGWLAARVSTRHVVDGYHEEDFELWDSTGRLVAQSRQLALLSTQSS